jgi:hypothetical protein
MWTRKKNKFPLGRILLTPGAASALARAEQDPTPFLRRHEAGDWGNESDEIFELMNTALKEGEMVQSVYETRLGETIWVITDGSRTETTILLPWEY